MPKRWAILLLLATTPALAKPPRLTLFISVDGMGSDLLLRSRPRFTSGLAQLMNGGAYFPTARYRYAQVVTAVGHATLSTGANPWRHGIVGNKVFNRLTGKHESALTDPNHPVLEAPLTAEDVSPENLLAETLADRLRIATQGRAKVFSVSAKARAAITLGGRLGQAYWFNESVGKFVTGTWYAKELPPWLKSFNDKKLADGYLGKEWTLFAPRREYLGEDDRPFESDWFALGRVFPHRLSGGLTEPGPQGYFALGATPFMNDILVQVAKAALEGEQLGKDEVPDALFVSFSAIDRTYHLFGPYSWEVQDAMLRLDRSIAELLAAADKAAGGRANLLVVLSADHGGAAVPEEWAAAGMPAARVNPLTVQQGLAKELQSRFAAADLVVGIEESSVYLSAKAIADRKLDPAIVRRAAAQWMSQQPSVALAVARDDLFHHGPAGGLLRTLQLGYHPERSGEVLFVLKPFQVMTEELTGTSHGSPYAYDTDVPVLLAGKGVKPGLYREEIDPTDIAPTVAALLEIGSPSLAEGTVRVEALSAGR